MTREEFEQLVAEEFSNAVPKQFRSLIKNVAFLVEDEPDAATRKEEGLRANETLLGLYRGIPATARGDFYGVGATLPDTITLFQNPILDEAAELLRRQAGERVRSGPLGQVLPSFTRPGGFGACVRRVVRATIWHEVAHHFGYDEHQVRAKEEKRNKHKPEGQ